MSAAAPARSGLALLLTVGILTMLALAGAALAAMAGQLRAGSALQLDRTAARLLARAGIEYASARLFQDTRTPSTPTSANQSDDWTFRDDPATSPEKSRNPSYAQTEPYLDLNANGRYDEGLDTLPPAGDWDKDGALDSWSGRLRERHGMTGGTFTLKIEAAAAGISVNGGELRSADLNENNKPDYADLGEIYKRGLSDVDRGARFDEMGHRNRRISDLIDRLAAVVGAASDCGERIVRGRPPGGYQDLRGFRHLLPEGSFERMAPYLAVTSGGRALQGDAMLRLPHYISSAYLNYPCMPDLRQAVPLARAPRQVLQSMLQGLLTLNSGDGLQAEPAFPPVATIGAEDAARVADFLIANRSPVNWQQLYRALLDNRAALFPGTLPFQDELKADVVFAAANPDDSGTWVDYWWLPPFSAWSYDLDRGAGPYGYGSAAYTGGNGMPLQTLRRRRLSKLGIWSERRKFQDSGGTAYEGYGSIELSLEDPGTFSIESLGRARDREGRAGAAARFRMELAVRRNLLIKSQEDFENLYGNAEVAPGLRKTGKPIPDRVTSYPMFSLESCPDLAGTPGPPPWDDISRGKQVKGYPGSFPSGYRYAPYCGDLRLMHVALPRDPADAELVFHVPVWEKGQPFRKDPAGAAADNFRDEAGGAAFIGFLDPLLAPTYTLGIGGNPAFPGTVPTQAAYSDKQGFSWANNIAGPTAYRWQGDFPLAEGGAVQRGTFEFWAAMTAGGPNWRQENPMRCYFTRLFPNNIGWMQLDPAGNATTNATFPAGVAVPDWHHAMAVVGSQRVTVFLNGIPRLLADYDPQAGNPAQPQELGFKGWVGMFRMYTSARSDAASKSLQPRYWTPDPLDPELASPPSFTSALYRFDRAVAVGDVRWNGFVPKAIREAADADLGLSPSARDPLRITLLCWSDPDGAGPVREIPLPPALWRDGGGTVPCSIPNVRSLKYRVEMDAGAQDSTRETPVLDSISIGYKTGGKLASFSEE